MALPLARETLLLPRPAILRLPRAELLIEARKRLFNPSAMLPFARPAMYVVTPNSWSKTAPGTYTFPVPNYYSLMVDLWGAGGTGGGGINSGQSGSSGSASSFGATFVAGSGSSYTGDIFNLIANPGGGGGPGSSSSSGDSKSGYNTDYYYGGAGSAGTGSGPTGSTVTNGGGSAGVGGGDGYAGPGGAGGRVKMTFTRSANVTRGSASGASPMPGNSITVIVGSANGAVYISWS